MLQSIILCLALAFQFENKVEPLVPQPQPVIIQYYLIEQRDGSHKWVPMIWYPTWDEVRRGVKFRDATKYKYPRNNILPETHKNRKEAEISESGGRVKTYDPTSYGEDAPVKHYVPGRYSPFDDVKIPDGPPYKMKKGDKNPFERYSPEWRKWNGEYIYNHSDPVGGQ